MGIGRSESDIAVEVAFVRVRHVTYVRFLFRRIY